MKNFVIFMCLVVAQPVFAQTSGQSPSAATKRKVAPAEPTNTQETIEEVKELPQEPSQSPVGQKVEEVIAEKAPEVEKKIRQSRTIRGSSKWVLNAQYSPLDMLIPNKIGASVGYNQTADQTWELQYLRGKVSAPFFIEDIGSVTDEKISLMGRTFYGNSFNLSYGITYFRFKVHIGSDLLANVTALEAQSVDLLIHETVGANIGIGNRWSLGKYFVLGIDWAELYQPLIKTREESPFISSDADKEDRDDVRDALDWAGKFPRLSFLKLSLGATF